MNTTISVRSIIAWVKSLKPSDPVGRPKSGCDCLVAEYIYRKLGGTSIFVSDRGWVSYGTYENGYHSYLASPQIRRLIHAFDASFPKYDWVTAEQALDWLETQPWTTSEEG